MKILNGLGDNEFIAYRSDQSQKYSGEIPVIEIYDLNELENLKPDAALITNPTSMHFQTALELTKFSIPLFIEKPAGKDLKDADALIKITEEKNIPVLIGYNFLYHPAITEIQKLLKNNKIGNVISARAQFGTYMPGWHKGEDHKKSYAALRSLGGGVILTSIHEQNYLTSLFGKVTDVKAMETGGSVIGIESEEGAEILMKHESGIVSNIHLNFYQKPYYRNLQIIGTEGTIYWDFKIPEIKIMTDENTETIRLGEDAMELLDKSYTDQMIHFTDIVKNNELPKADLSIGIEDVDVALKILDEINSNNKNYN